MIGVMGGTFDPIHFGHLRPALEIVERVGIERLHWVPVNVPPHRSRPTTAPEHRLAMVERAVAPSPNMVADRRELERAGPSYTVDTLQSFRDELGPDRPLVLLMGMDAFTGLSSWHRWREIPDLAHIVVAHRPGSPAAEELDDVFPERRTETPAALHAAPAGRLLFRQVTQLDISSTRIRGLLRDRRDPRYLLPDAVLDYITREGLFGVR